MNIFTMVMNQTQQMGQLYIFTATVVDMRVAANAPLKLKKNNLKKQIRQRLNLWYKSE
jgi:hypothetical protein